MFRSLAGVNYRIWAAGAIVSNVGTWMQRTAQDWIVLTQLTHNNASAVGFVMALQFGPQLLLLPVTGWAADHLDRRRLLMLTQGLMGLLGLGLGLLTVSGAVQLWHVYLFALALLVNPLFAAPGHFDIRALGLARAAAYLGAMAVLLSALAPRGRAASVAAAAVLALVFCDVGYVAYFNSGYTEASSFVFGMLAAGFFLRLTLAPRASPIDLAGFTVAAMLLMTGLSVQAQHSKLVNEPVDISGDFRDFSNTIFFADSLAAFDPATTRGGG